MEEAEGEFPAYDATGHKVTDYSNTKYSDERARILTRIELEYVNGVQTEDNEMLYWPSQNELAAKYKLPQKTVNACARRYNWTQRRNIRRAALHRFDFDSTRRKWTEMDERVSERMQDMVTGSLLVTSRLLWEKQRKVEQAVEEETKLKRDGEANPLVECGVSLAEIKGIADTVQKLESTRASLMNSVTQNLKLEVAEIPMLDPPEPLRTVKEEKRDELEAAEIQAEIAREEEEIVPESTLREIYAEIVQSQQSVDQARENHVVQGEWEEEDDDA